MRRLSLSTKLFAAALPLIVAVVGLLALTVRSDLDEIDRAQSGAELGRVWEPLISALTAVEAETDTADVDPAAQTGEAVDPAVRRATDQAINDLRVAIEGLGAFDAASAHVTSSRSALSAARRGIDMASIAPSMAGDVDPVEAYRVAGRELVAVGQLLPAEAGDPQLGEELLAVVKLAEARLYANDVIAGTEQWAATSETAPLVQARAAFTNLQTTLGEFEAIAPDEWTAQFRQSGFTTELNRYGTSLGSVVRAAQAGQVQRFDTAGFTTLVDDGIEFQRAISQSIVDRSNELATTTRSSTLIRIGVILLAALVGLVIAWFITRSVTRRVKAVADSANLVAQEQLPALVEALRDPRGKAVLPDIEPLDDRGTDDLAELAAAFNSMQETLIDVAHEQVEVLRRGVSDIFITMARRNRSLIDRQLAMLDEYEASVDDHEILSNYYQLDHLATRMRRNSESLLVLANAEPKRRRVKATEIDDVVRASIGEVEDYKRIEIQHLDSLQVKGTVVADISHLLAELLDNATSFSPPGSTVRVGGRRADQSYMIRIVDDGVGAAPERLTELNELLREPPIVGLAVESTLGISVVSLLANKHGIDVTLSAGSPGMTVDVVLPGSVFGPMDAPTELPTLPSAGAAPAPTGPAAEPIVAWDEQPAAAEEPEVFEPEVVEPATAEADPYAMPERPAADAPLRIPDDIAAGLTARPNVDELWADEPTPDESTAIEPTAIESTAADAALRIPEPEPSTPVDVPAVAAEPEPTAPVAPQPERDWTSMSLDLSAFESSTPTPAHEPTPEPDLTPEAAPEPTFHAAPEPTFTTSQEWATTPEPTFDATPEPETAPEPEVDAAPTFDAPAAPAAPAAPSMPPPPPTIGEFDVPPAPPIGAGGLAHRPVTPAGARPAPDPTPPPPAAPALPTRSQRGTGPEGPDRLAMPATDESTVTTSEPGALQAALAAFDSGRAAVSAQPAGTLPTRDRVGDPVPQLDEPQSVTQSRVDPSALRDRLRAFQSEFSSANGADHTEEHRDLGGDPR